MSESEILLDRAGSIVILTINRPQALNALTLQNYYRFAAALDLWAADPAVQAVIVRGAGGRAFCAGGDVRAIYDAGRGFPGGSPKLTADFFRVEYQLIRNIHRFPKPYIAIVNGITMGGGAGISVNGAYRVATERTMLAMPETAIGLFPDVGATRFLNRCPGQVGRYLGLTGARLKGADALYCGLATHFIAEDRLNLLSELLATMTPGRGANFTEVDTILSNCAESPGPAPLSALRCVIDRCFLGDTIETILDALAREAASRSPHATWAAETRAGLESKSPTSLKVTLRQLIVGRDLDIEGALQLEYRLTQHFMAGHDFYEGVRALLVDKDRRPRWHPRSVSEVDSEMVEAYFSPLGERELRF